MLRKFHNTAYRALSFLLLHKVAFMQKLSQRRHYRRQNCHISVDISYQNKHVAAIIRNINEYGALVSTNHSFQSGDTVHLTFPLHYLDPPIEMKATIVWTDCGSAGLQFDCI